MEQVESSHDVKDYIGIACLSSGEDESQCVVKHEAESWSFHKYPCGLVSDFRTPVGCGQISISCLEEEQGHEDDDSHYCHAGHYDIICIHTLYLDIQAKVVNIFEIRFLWLLLLSFITGIT
jgi:hypothetical protein